MILSFEEVSVKGVKKWKDKNGRRHQQTMKFYQTISPFNKNPNGSLKTREEIFKQITKERDNWLEGKPV